MERDSDVATLKYWLGSGSSYPRMIKPAYVHMYLSKTITAPYGLTHRDTFHAKSLLGS